MRSHRCAIIVAVVWLGTAFKRMKQSSAAPTALSKKESRKSATGPRTFTLLAAAVVPVSRVIGMLAGRVSLLDGPGGQSCRATRPASAGGDHSGATHRDGRDEGARDSATRAAWCRAGHASVLP